MSEKFKDILKDTALNYKNYALEKIDNQKQSNRFNKILKQSNEIDLLNQTKDNLEVNKLRAINLRNQRLINKHIFKKNLQNKLLIRHLDYAKGTGKYNRIMMRYKYYLYNTPLLDASINRKRITSLLSLNKQRRLNAEIDNLKISNSQLLYKHQKLFKKYKKIDDKFGLQDARKKYNNLITEKEKKEFLKKLAKNINKGNKIKFAYRIKKTYRKTKDVMFKQTIGNIESNSAEFEKIVQLGNKKRNKNRNKDNRTNYIIENLRKQEKIQRKHEKIYKKIHKNNKKINKKEIQKKLNWWQRRKYYLNLRIQKNIVWLKKVLNKDFLIEKLKLFTKKILVHLIFLLLPLFVVMFCIGSCMLLLTNNSGVVATTYTGEKNDYLLLDEHIAEVTETVASSINATIKSLTSNADEICFSANEIFSSEGYYFDPHLISAFASAKFPRFGTKDGTSTEDVKRNIATYIENLYSLASKREVSIKRVKLKEPIVIYNPILKEKIIKEYEDVEYVKVYIKITKEDLDKIFSSELMSDEVKYANFQGMKKTKGNIPDLFPEKLKTPVAMNGCVIRSSFNLFGDRNSELPLNKRLSIELEGQDRAYRIVPSNPNDPKLAKYLNNLHNLERQEGNTAAPDQCTSLCKDYISVRYGIDPGKSFGHGGDWAYHAQKDGYHVKRTPRAGDVASYPKGAAGAETEYGHVAIVKEVYPDGSILISERNYERKLYNERIISKSEAEKGLYIDFGKKNKP